MYPSAKKTNPANGESLHAMLEQLEAIDFCDCPDDLDLLCGILFEAKRIRDTTHQYIEFNEFD